MIRNVGQCLSPFRAFIRRFEQSDTADVVNPNPALFADCTVHHGRLSLFPSGLHSLVKFHGVRLSCFFFCLSSRLSDGWGGTCTSGEESSVELGCAQVDSGEQQSSEEWLVRFKSPERISECGFFRSRRREPILLILVLHSNSSICTSQLLLKGDSEVHCSQISSTAVTVGYFP